MSYSVIIHGGTHGFPKTLGEAFYTILQDGTGLKCPHGCSGCSIRWYGLVTHLMERHGYSKKRAEKRASKEMYCE